MDPMPIIAFNCMFGTLKLKRWGGGALKRPKSKFVNTSSPRKIPPLDLEDLVNGQVLAPKQGGYILELQEAQLELEAMTQTLVALGDVLNTVGGRTPAITS